MTIAKLSLYYAAAAATAIAGMIHLMLGPGNLSFNVNQGILFIAGGTAQVFWIIPIIKRWGRTWYGIGLAGTTVLMVLFFITRVQGNPITGRGGGANTISILVEIFEGIFIGIAAALIVYESRKKQIVSKTSSSEHISKRDKRAAPILAGIVIALVLAGLFVLPMIMPRPMGGPFPGRGGTAGPPPSGITGQNETQGQSLTQLAPLKNLG